MCFGQLNYALGQALAAKCLLYISTALAISNIQVPHFSLWNPLPSFEHPFLLSHRGHDAAPAAATGGRAARRRAPRGAAAARGAPGATPRAAVDAAGEATAAAVERDGTEGRKALRGGVQARLEGGRSKGQGWPTINQNDLGLPRGQGVTNVDPEVG